MPTASPARAPQVLGALLLLVALALVVGGAMLVAVGGSWFYALAGLAAGAAGVLLVRCKAAGLGVLAALVGATLAWSLWEVGLDWWPLAARLDVLFVLGLVALVPAVARPLAGARANAAALGVALGACALVAVGAGLRDPHDIAGALPAADGGASAPDMGFGSDAASAGEWLAYGRTDYGQRYSPLAQITPANVGQLQLAWQFRTGDLRGKPGDPEETTDEVTPLKIGERLFLCTPHQQVIALDATTGKQLWRYDPKIAIADRLALQHLTCRGLSYQPPSPPSRVMDERDMPRDGEELPLPTRPGLPVAFANGPQGECNAMLFMATADARLIALDPETGAVCGNFARGAGQVDLAAHMPNVKAGSYYSTSPPVVAQGRIVVGGTVLDNYSTHEESGVIRAFDSSTGRLIWNWDSGNPEATEPIAPGATYTANSPNSWSISSVDRRLDMVYAPIGNQPPDQFGGKRSAAVEKVSSSVVALALRDGSQRWVFQTVHHDLWDYDVPSQPSLVDLTIGGATVPALVQPTKQGELFVLDRRTGRPLLPVTEVPAPGGAAPGDHSAPTQPKSAASFEPPPLTPADMWGGTIFDQLACRIAFHKLAYHGRFTPPSTQGSLIYPGNFGVFNWGGVAVDPRRQIAFTTPTYLAFTSTLVARPDDTALLVQHGGKPPGALPPLNENFGAPYAAKMGPFLSPLGIPCQAPPWGYVAGVDLRTGRIAWKHRNGTVRDLSPIPLPIRMGVPDLGGPVVTAGGVAFLSGSMDDYVRAYDVTDGRQLWQERLPAGGQATPMTYTGADGREYLLVVAGGHGSTHTKPGDYVIAYALPRR